MIEKEPINLPAREPTERDVEFLRVWSQLAFRLAAVDRAGFAVGVAAFGIPGWAVVEVSRALAGRTTTVNLGVTLTLTVTVLGLGYAFWRMLRKARSQAAELRRLRQHVQDLRELLWARHSGG